MHNKLFKSIFYSNNYNNKNKKLFIYNIYIKYFSHLFQILNIYKQLKEILREKCLLT